MDDERAYSKDYFVWLLFNLCISNQDKEILTLPRQMCLIRFSMEVAQAFGEMMRSRLVMSRGYILAGMSTAVVVAIGDGIKEQDEVVADDQEEQENDTVSYEHIE